ncbi:MAG TPA: S9 family peptidase [Nevskiaceae bacterium]|nr:S9 family peptidase [Nevskiaceae bacterium]
MRVVLCAALAALCCSPSLPAAEAPPRVERGNLVLEGVPEVPAALAERLNQYQQTRSASLEGWLADGSLLITTRFAETAQVHRVKTPGGARTQLTFFAEPINQAQPAPDGSGFLYTRDRGGDEFYQLYWYALASGESRLLSDGKSRNTGPRWSRRGDRFAYASTRRNGRDSDIWLGRLDGSAQPLLQREGSWSVVDWSPDDRRLLVQRYRSITDSELWLVEVDSGEARRFHERSTPIAFGDAVFSADGRGLYYLSDEGADVRQLRYEDLDGGNARVLTADVPWDVEELAISPDGRHLAYRVNADGLSTLTVLDLPRNRPLPLPVLPAGVFGNLRFDPRGERLGLTLNNARTPSDVYSFRLGQRQLTRWTESETGGLDASRFTEPSLVRYPSFDGLSVPAFYYRPAGDGPHPVLISIHGGPEAQALPLFNPLIEYYARELGVAVLVPNVRGSSGYGKAYLARDNGYLREDSVKDIGALLDWIGRQPELDAGRVIVTGGSYGGYMTLAALTHYNERLLGGIAIVGISNFVTFLTNTQEYRRDLRRVEYGDERDPAMRAHLEKISPTTNASRITRPLYVIQGLNDPRVPASEAEQMVRTVRGNGGEVWYLLARDEGHGFRKKANRDLQTNTTVLFIQRLIGQAAAGGG